MPRTFVWHRTRGPKVTPKREAPTGGKVKVTQVRSGIGHSWRMRLVLKSLGLRHHQASVIHNDTVEFRGQVNKVRHLVTVSAVKE
jgi:large subunit ribosomal protein L30